MPAVAETLDTVQSLTSSGYKWGFETDIEMDVAPKGLNEDTIRLISARKVEPEWLLAWRLKAYRAWLEMAEPDWARVGYPPIDYQDIHYYAAPKKKDGPRSLDEVDPELLRTYAKLGIPLKEQAILAGVVGTDGESAAEGAAQGRQIAVDAVFDSVSVATTFRASISAAWFRPVTTTSPPSTARCSPTAPSCSCQRVCAARWSCPPISASMPRTAGSSSAR
jgi:Fe-S cluster assembly protein SufB